MQCKAADQSYRCVCLFRVDRDILTFAINIISVFFLLCVCVWGGDNLKVRAAAIFVTVDSQIVCLYIICDYVYERHYKSTDSYHFTVALNRKLDKDRCHHYVSLHCTKLAQFIHHL